MQPTEKDIEGLSPLKRAYLALQETQSRLAALENARTEPIAVIGIACRMPGGALDIEGFWRLLSTGQDAVDEAPADRWDAGAFHDPDPDVPGKMITRCGSFLSEVDQFDAAFFGISPREAEGIDPQQRLLLEIAHDALDDAGIPVEHLSDSECGVFIGLCGFDYTSILARRDVREVDAYGALGVSHSVACGRVSYLLGLHGPSIAVDTACSSSLVALHAACQSLRWGECSSALVGSSNLLLDPRTSIIFTKARMLSPDGRCKTFSAAADGYGRGEGAGVVVLKRLSDALAAGDRIRAVIRGTAVNQDGASSGLTVPNGIAQQAVIRRALAESKLQPDEIDYIEAHGTGTPLGDPIEMGAIGAVFGERQEPLWVGSVKTNIGHLEGTAGMSGLIKVILALEHEEIPPHLHFHTPSAHIPWDRLPVKIPTAPTPWPAGERPRRAGVSSFGFAGTNAHVIVEEAPRVEDPRPPVSRPQQLITVSAKSPVALAELARRYAAHLAERPELDLADVSWTTTAGRSHFPHRAAVLAGSLDEARAKLEALKQGMDGPGVFQGDSSGAGRLAFLFSGQGSQYVGMGRGLYQQEPVFRAVIDQCEAILRDQLPQPLTEVLFEGPASGERPLDQTGYTQPALFALQAALAELWQSWGLRPAWLAGHSVGEYAAAYMAGVFSLEDGLRLIAARGRLMQQLPRVGTMVAVSADEATVAQAVDGYAADVSLAAINGPRQVVISGRAAAVDAVVNRLREKKIATQPLQVSHAFHSPLMEPMLSQFAEIASKVSYQAPRRSIVSNLTGRIEATRMADAKYWCEHVRQPVRFEAGMEAMFAAGAETFLELGPQATLLGLARSCWESRKRQAEPRWLPSLHPQRQDDEMMLAGLAQLYVSGENVDWSGFANGFAGRVISLPSYPFQRQRYWASGLSKAKTEPGSSQPWVHPLLGFAWQSAAAADWLQFEASLGAASPSYLGDHRLWGTAVLPGAAYLEMALAAAARIPGHGQIELSDVAFEQALRFEEGKTRRVQFVARPEGESFRWEVYSCSEKTSATGGPPPWIRHASGTLARRAAVDPPPPTDVLNLQSRLTEHPSLPEFYAGLRAMGLEYGENFRGLKRLWHAAGEVLGELELPGPAPTDLSDYQIHPALLDGCFQALALMVAEDSAGAAYVPVGAERLEIWRPAGPRIFGHARLRDSAPSESPKQVQIADIDILAPDGTLVARLTGLRAQRVDRESMLGQRKQDTDPWLYQVAWQEAEAPAGKATNPLGGWLILADHEGIGQALAEEMTRRGGSCVLVLPGEQLERLEPSASDIRRYRVDPARKDDFLTVIEEVFSEGDGQARLRGVVHLWSVGLKGDEDQAFAGAHRLACGSTLHLVQALLAHKADVRLWLVTQGIQAARDSAVEGQTVAFRSAKGRAFAERKPTLDTSSLVQSPVWALGGVIAVECPHWKTTRVDLAPGPDIATQAATLAVELTRADEEDQIAYCGGRRRVARLRRRSECSSRRAIPRQPHRVQLRRYGMIDELHIAPAARRAPAAGEVEIEVAAAGLNFRDVLRALGMLADYEKEHLGIEDAPDAWFGFECAGRVAAIGPGVANLALGDEVLAMAPASLSSYVTLPAPFVIRKPAGLSMEEAATVPMAYVTASYALEHLAKLQRGERVLIHAAAGGVGQAAVKLAQAAGAEIWATAHPDKWEALRAMGIQHVMNSRTQEFAQQIDQATGGAGVDVVLNSLSGEFIPSSVNCLAKGGRFVELGKLGIWTQEQMAAARPDAAYFAFDLGEEERRQPGLLGRILAGLGPRLEGGELRPLPHRTFGLAEVVDAFRFIQQARHVGKVVIRMDQPQPLAVPEASYLITGGLGALGLKVADWLVGQGARRLVLASREGLADKGNEAPLAALRSRGAEVEIVKADVTQAADIDRLLAEASSEGRPLRGVVHLAGVLDDGLLIDCPWTRFERVLRPKVAGAWRLSQQTRDLDFFVMFSSAAAVSGSEGQGNYAAANGFLDALAHWRRGRGQPALSVNYSIFGEVGMAARMDRRKQEHLTERGVQWIPIKAGLEVLERLLDEEAAQAAVLPIQWHLWAKNAGVAAPLWRDLAAIEDDAVDAGPPPMVLRLREAPADERMNMLVDALRREVASVLGWKSLEQVGRRQRFFDLGMDSLTSVELRRRLEKNFGCPLPVTTAFDYPTPEAVAGYLAEQLHLDDEPAAAEEEVQSVDATAESLEGLSDEEVGLLIQQELQNSVQQ
jgi:myxalamid-type polyketide synthase MxaB